MTKHVSNMETLPLFARFVERTLGLSFSDERLPELARKMAALSKEAGCADQGKYLAKLMSTPLSRQQLDTLASTLTIGETYFLRDPKSYQLLENHLLPELIAARRSTDKTLRIWSAGCSSGEEPYSLAILLSRVIPDLAKWKVTLLASDVNPLALERGRRGVYGKWSFRNAPPWLMGYFSKREDGRFEILPRIREMVRFSNINLAEAGIGLESYGASEMDIIFCRNVMLYFNPAQIKKTMAKFHAALKETGWLFVGPAEVDREMYQGFSCRHFGGAFALRKGGDEQKDTGTPSPAIPRSGKQGGDCSSAPSSDKQEGDWLRSCLSPSSAAAGNRPEVFPQEEAAAPAAHPPASSGPVLGSSAPESPAAAKVTGPDGYAEAQALYRAGSYQEAADLARACIEAGEEPSSAWELGARAYANIGSFAKARECCEKAIHLDKINPHNHYLLSIILEQLGDSAAAVRSLKHVLFIDHDYLLAYVALGNLNLQCGDETESERNFAIALRLLERRDPNDLLPEAGGMTAGSLARIIRGRLRNKRG